MIVFNFFICKVINLLFIEVFYINIYTGVYETKNGTKPTIDKNKH